MKIALILLVGNLVPLALIGVSVYMMNNHIKGAGWLIGAAIITMVTVSSRKDKESE